jgi:autotransporter-associated beta strand protein/T5SS/PEP-CTERM-associated repeat protein
MMPQLNQDASRSSRRSQICRSWLIAACAAALPAAARAGTYTVTQSSDDGTGATAGTLSWAIHQANADPGSTINFSLAANSTIALGAALPQITASVTIDGSDVTGLTLDGQSNYGIFSVNASGDNIVVKNLNIANGLNQVGGNDGGLFVGAGHVSVADVTFSGAGNADSGFAVDGVAGTSGAQTSGALSAYNEVIGHSASGTFDQSGGSNSITNKLALGNQLGAVGSYHLSGADSTLTTVGTGVGVNGVGTFTQDGGTHTASLQLVLATNKNATGTYNLNSGALNTADTYVSDFGTAIFNQADGTHTISGGLHVGFGYNILAGGTYNLSGGSLSADKEYVGDAGIGIFKQTGGDNTVTSNLYIGNLEQLGLGFSVGTYTLSGTSSTLSAANTYVGYEGIGTFNQSGGTHTVTGELDLGHDATGNGTYNLSGGTVSANSISVGYSGAGTFAQTGGTNTVTTLLDLGSQPNSSGSYSLSGEDSQLSTANTGVGDRAPGAFNQAGGTHTISSNLVIGSAASGVYTLSDGSLSAATEYVGQYAAGTLTQSGGTNTVSGDLYIGLGAGDHNPLAHGTYNLGDGSLSASNEYVGLSASSGTFSQTGGGNTASNLYIGVNAGFSGSYSLDGDDSTLSTVATVVGSNGSGAFTQAGGAHSISGNLVLGNSSTGSGTYELDGGSLAAPTEVVGVEGAGAFTQTAGTNTLSGDLSLAANSAAATGTYTLSGSSASALSTQNTYVGLNGTATFTQSGGAHTASNLVAMGYNAGSSGTYALSGGSLSAPSEYIGAGGTGLFTQTGGGNSTALLLIGFNADASGSYTLDGDTSTLSAGTTVVGYYGTGTFTQSGGTNTVSGNLVLGGLSTAAGTYKLNGGSLTASVIAGGDGTSTFDFNGGTIHANADSTDTLAFIFGLTTANIQAGGATIDTNGHNVTVTQSFSHDSALGSSSDGGLTKSGTGTLTLAAAGTYTGGVTVNAGTLSIDNNNELGDVTGEVAVADGATLLSTGGVVTGRIINLSTTGQLVTTPGGSITYSAASITGGSLGAGNHYLNSGTILDNTTFADGSNVTVNGAVQASTLNLAGSLTNHGSISGVLNINGGGIATGTGQYGQVNLGSGGIFHPGDSPGIATSADTAWSGGGLYQFDINDAAGSAGNNWSLWTITGTLTLNATRGNQFILDVSSVIGDSDVSGDIQNFDMESGYSWLIAQASGGITGFDPADILVDTTGFSNSTDGLFSINQIGNGLYLNYSSSVPEPTMLSLLSLAGLLICRRRRGGVEQRVV